MAGGLIFLQQDIIDHWDVMEYEDFLNQYLSRMPDIVKGLASGRVRLVKVIDPTPEILGGNGWTLFKQALLKEARFADQKRLAEAKRVAKARLKKAETKKKK